jgi:hypothetical protein
MNRVTIVSLLGLVLTLTACDKTKTALGLNRNVNDEFAIMTTPPLELPPNFNDLPSPVAKSADAGLDNNAVDKARDAAMSQFSHSVAHKTSVAANSSEEALLKNAQAHNNDPNIRQTIGTETKAEANKNKSFVKDLLNIKDSSSGKALDPFEEKKRLEETPSNQDS